MLEVGAGADMRMHTDQRDAMTRRFFLRILYLVEVDAVLAARPAGIGLVRFAMALAGIDADRAAQGLV